MLNRATELGNNLLLKNGVKPEWVELQQMMTALKDYLRSRIRYSWARYSIKMHERRRDTSSPHESLVNNVVFRMPDEDEQIPFIASCTQELQDDLKICNDVIDTYNLQVPSYLLTRGRLSLDEEVVRCMKMTSYSSVSEARKTLTDCESVYEQTCMQRNLARLNGFGQDRHRGRIVKRWKDDSARQEYDISKQRSSSTWNRNTDSHSHQRSANAGEVNLIDKLLDGLVAVVEKPGNVLATYMMRWL